MTSIRSFILRLLNLFRKDELDRDLHDELSMHLALHTEDNLRAGMTLRRASQVDPATILRSE